MNTPSIHCYRLAGASRGCARQAGLTLVELMISIVLGLLVVMAATALLVTTKSGYTHEDEATRIEESGRYALEIITRALHQTAYENWDADGSPLIASSTYSANIQGLDASDVGKQTTGIESPSSSQVNGSDVLAVRYFGVGGGNNGDGSVLNCAGFGVAAPASQDEADLQEADGGGRGWSIFHVDNNSSGEPELRCKYRGNDGSFSSDAIVTGVESFQVLYGVDTDGDGMPNTYLNATGVDTLGATFWKSIVVVKIGLLMRASVLVADSTEITKYDLFGEDYGDTYGNTDKGTRIEKTSLSTATRNRLRKVFTQTIQLRNKSAGGGA